MRSSAVDRGLPADLTPLGTLLREDWTTHDRERLAPGLHAVVVHRVGRRTLGGTGLGARLVHGAARIAGHLVRNVYGIELPFSVELGRRTKFAHQGLIVVNGASRIGDDCLIRHGVTLGAPDDVRTGEAPVIGDGVEIGANAVVVGAVTIGAGSKIGPCALVRTTMPPGTRALAPTAIVRPPLGGAPRQ